MRTLLPDPEQGLAYLQPSVFPVVESNTPSLILDDFRAATTRSYRADGLQYSFANKTAGDGRSMVGPTGSQTIDLGPAIVSSNATMPGDLVGTVRLTMNNIDYVGTRFHDKFETLHVKMPNLYSPEFARTVPRDASGPALPYDWTDSGPFLAISIGVDEVVEYPKIFDSTTATPADPSSTMPPGPTGRMVGPTFRGLQLNTTTYSGDESIPSDFHVFEVAHYDFLFWKRRVVFSNIVDETGQN